MVDSRRYSSDAWQRALGEQADKNKTKSNNSMGSSSSGSNIGLGGVIVLGFVAAIAFSGDNDGNHESQILENTLSNTISPMTYAHDSKNHHVYSPNNGQTYPYVGISFTENGRFFISAAETENEAKNITEQTCLQTHPTEGCKVAWIFKQKTNAGKKFCAGVGLFVVDMGSVFSSLSGVPREPIYKLRSVLTQTETPEEVINSLYKRHNY